MPSLNSYKNMFVGARTNGQLYKKQSDEIMDATWWQDVQSRVAYLYDWYHDWEPEKLWGLNPLENPHKIPIDIKFIRKSSQTYEKDAVTFHLQLRPGQKCNVPYYDKYVEWYNSEFPLGLFVDIQDEQGIYRKWLIVAKADAYTNQFPTYEILPCDYCLKYIMDGNKMKSSVVLRSQNSYVFVRFIRETVCRKFSNCWKVLLGYQYHSVTI